MSRRAASKDPFDAVVAAHRSLTNNELVGTFASSIRLVRRKETRARRHWIDVVFGYSSRSQPGITAEVAPNLAAGLDEGEWCWILTRVAMHLALNHADPKRTDLPWHVACWSVAEAMLSSGNTAGAKRPDGLPPLPQEYSYRSETLLAQRLREETIPRELLDLNLGAAEAPYWTFAPTFEDLTENLRREATRRFAQALREAANKAVATTENAASSIRNGPATIARAWFVSNFPLLGALASRFAIVEDAAVCARYGIRVAAVNSALGEIYVNPLCALSADEMVFVLAHEMLHVGLRHDTRLRGRDPWLWNVACDYVINAWLMEMNCGTPPERVGYLFDADLSTASAEDVYDRIVGDLRILRRVRKSRGWAGDAPDMVVDRAPEWWNAGGGADLDAFYRRALSQGLVLHRESGRGTLPAGLVEEISALEQRPIPWDVELGHWLDEFFDPLETRRSFAIASRRQASTPDIVRAGKRSHERVDPQRTFGVVLDTSGSMERVELARALGAIRAYALAHDVFKIRMIQVDVVAHDNGFVEADDLLERFEVRGRGGTELMPGVTLLERSPDFPTSAPILVITDGYCDHVRSSRNHAFLLPSGRTLPFRTHAPIFEMRDAP